MNTTQFWLFISLFIAPVAYQRVHFHLNPDFFLEIKLRRRLRLQIHHGHWGLIWMIISGLLMSFGQTNTIITTIFGFGLGLLTDEIIPSLSMPSDDRKLELRVYNECLWSTIILVIMILFVISIAHFTLSPTLVK